MLWIIVANGTNIVELDETGSWVREHQYPTFFLQAHSEDEAKKKADDLLNPNGEVTLYLSVRLAQ